MRVDGVNVTGDQGVVPGDPAEEVLVLRGVAVPGASLQQVDAGQYLLLCGRPDKVLPVAPHLQQTCLKQITDIESTF